MNEYLITLVGDFESWHKIPEQEKQKLTALYTEYVSLLRTQNKLRGGSALKAGAFELSTKAEQTVVSGPLAGKYFYFDRLLCCRCRNRTRSLRNCQALPSSTAWRQSPALRTFKQLALAKTREIFVRFHSMNNNFHLI